MSWTLYKYVDTHLHTSCKAGYERARVDMDVLHSPSEHSLVFNMNMLDTWYSIVIV